MRKAAAIIATIRRGIITGSAVPLMVKPGSVGELSDEALHGMSVAIEREVIVENGEKWFLVKTSYRYMGYVNAKHLNVEEANENSFVIRKYEAGKKFYISGNFADVLSLPKVQGNIHICLPMGALIIKADAAPGEEIPDGWCKVMTADGFAGFIREGLISECRTGISGLSEQEFRENLARAALKYLKTQYRWGGKTPCGIDCSGLCSMAYMLNGVIIYRDASIPDESKGFPVKPIYIENMKKGDLIFFPGHVAMYLGEGRYIHSSAADNGVVIASLNKDDSGYRSDLAQKITQIGSIF